MGCDFGLWCVDVVGCYINGNLFFVIEVVCYFGELVDLVVVLDVLMVFDGVCEVVGSCV